MLQPGGYRDARLYERPSRGRRINDPDLDQYNAMFDKFLVLAGHFRIKKFIPQSNALVWSLPAYPGLTDAVNVSDTQDVLDAKAVIRFYRDKWLELEAHMDVLSNCNYVHARSKRTQSIVEYQTATGETFHHNLTTKPIMHESVPVNVFNPDTQRVETRAMYCDGQGIEATNYLLVNHGRTAMDYKKLLQSMIFENK